MSALVSPCPERVKFASVSEPSPSPTMTKAGEFALAVTETPRLSVALPKMIRFLDDGIWIVGTLLCLPVIIMLSPSDALSIASWSKP